LWTKISGGDFSSLWSIRPQALEKAPRVGDYVNLLLNRSAFKVLALADEVIE